MTPRSRLVLLWTLRVVLVVQSVGFGWEALASGASPAALAWSASALLGSLLALVGMRAGAAVCSVHALAYEVSLATMAGPTTLLEVPAHAVRLGVGLALVLMSGEAAPGRDRDAVWLLRGCVAASLLGQALLALTWLPQWMMGAGSVLGPVEAHDLLTRVAFVGVPAALMLVGFVRPRCGPAAR